jgi:hypothetical protein
MGREGSKFWPRFLKKMWNASKCMAKFHSKKKKKLVRNIQPKNSKVIYLNEYCLDHFQNVQNQLWGPIWIQNQVRVFYFSPASLLALALIFIIIRIFSSKYH